MRTARVLLLGLVAVALAGPASAASTAPGAAILAVQLGRGVADVLQGDGRAFSHSELGVQAQYWYFLREDYGLNLSTGIGYFKENVTADPADPLAADVRFTFNSWQVRIGGDRFAKVSDKLLIYAGPGFQIWSGNWEVENASGSSEVSTNLRVGVTGRLGTLIMMGENFGLIGHVGQYWAYATGESGGTKTKWLPSGTEGAMGFSFGF